MENERTINPQKGSLSRLYDTNLERQSSSTFPDRSQGDDWTHRVEQIGRTTAGSAMGAALGAGSGLAASIFIGGAAGSAIPGIGTVIGAALGGIVTASGISIAHHRRKSSDDNMLLRSLLDIDEIGE